MNHENVKKVIAYLKELESKPDPEVRFDMRNYFGRVFIEDDVCKTSACLAGHTVLCLAPHVGADYENLELNWHLTAEYLLGLTEVESYHLFLEYCDDNVTLPEAIEVLERFEQTGDMDWLTTLNKREGGYTDV